jgi:hypothetical protein
MKDREKFLKAITEGVVTVEFKKVGTEEIRIMPCTLSPELSNGKVQEQVGQLPESDHYAVWCLDKDAWRSFRCNTVTDWYEGYPEEKEAARLIAEL